MSSDLHSPSEDAWKARYIELKARLASKKTALHEIRAALEGARSRESAMRTRIAALREQLRVSERARLSPHVVEHLLPQRSSDRRGATPSPAELAREANHLRVSPPYGDVVTAGPPRGAVRVDDLGVTWWVPDDHRTTGRIADRVLSGTRSQIVEILQTREAIGAGVMLDIGANIGLTSVTRALLGDFDIVYAAEPAPDNFACLVHTVLMNGLRGLVLPDRVAISNVDGMARLHLAKSIGGHALSERGDGLEVPTFTVDSWLMRLGVAAREVQFVKVDTQGREGHVLDGASSLLARPGVVWNLEFSPTHLAKAGRSARALIAQLQHHFSHFVDLSPDGLGSRVRSVAELSDALGYLRLDPGVESPALDASPRSYTNLLVYRT